MNILRRVGKFTIPRKLIANESQLIMSEVMARCVVVRAEMLWEFCAVEYVAISPDFDEIEEGAAAPYYDLKIVGPNAWFERRA